MIARRLPSVILYEITKMLNHYSFFFFFFLQNVYFTKVFYTTRVLSIFILSLLSLFLTLISHYRTNEILKRFILYV